jgi:cystathionine beta-lyase/cystathionine gamma-synthase
MPGKDNTPPIHISSSFHFDTVADMRHQLTHELDTPFYTRGFNPTVAELRKQLAQLEGTEDALVFSSGSAAVAMAVMSVVQAGDHIVSVAKPYSWTKHLFADYLTRFGVETTFVDGTKPDNFREAAKPNTRLFFLESPNSMTFELQDIAAIGAIASALNVKTAIDNSCASPLFQQPAKWGIDLVIHSATKYLNGHHDVVAGVVCGSHKLIRQMMKEEFMTLGAISSPHDAWMILRGLRTLPLRMEKHEINGRAVVAFLERHPKIKRVHYPFATGNPQRELARRQMSGAGSLFSIELDAPDIAAVERFCNTLQYFIIGPSWGGYESILFPACVLHDSANYSETTLPWNLVRLFVGLEDKEVIISDLEQALQNV